MKKYKNPILLQQHLDLAKSGEAKEQLIRLEAEYQKERKEQEETFFTQDNNFYQGLKDGLHAQFQEQTYLDYKDDRRLRLQDKYLAQADETLEHYHPELFEQIHEQEQRDHKQEVEMAKNLNDGYYMERHEPKLALVLRQNIGDITRRTEHVQNFVKGQELSLEERETTKQEAFKENTMEVSKQTEQDLTIETDNEPDLDLGDNGGTVGDIHPDKGFSPDIDD
ncbi:MAG TPA: hypothetical protein PLC80_01665 [Draconibacterium sp.]|nr:hypothetical protein [Draconibacterium sp.]